VTCFTRERFLFKKPLFFKIQTEYSNIIRNYVIINDHVSDFLITSASQLTEENENRLRPYVKFIGRLQMSCSIISNNTT
jgi:hypothetical protein